MPISRRSRGIVTWSSPRRSALGGAELISADPDDRRLSEVSRADLKRLLGLVDMFMPSRQDADAMFPGRAPLDALRALRDLAPDLPVIVIKCGADGAIAHRRGAPDYVALPAIAEAMVDETGAGDAFCGGGLVGFSRKADLVEALVRGSVSASFAVEAVGPDALLRASPEVAARRLHCLMDRVELHPL